MTGDFPCCEPGAEERARLIESQRGLSDDDLLRKIATTTNLHEGAIFYATMQDYCAGLRDLLGILDDIRSERGLEWPAGVPR